jgi:hypothetical protein
VAIGEKTRVNYSIIKDSIIGSFADLYDIVLTHSLIGSDTEVKGESRSLNIGDNTEIDLGRILKTSTDPWRRAAPQDLLLCVKSPQLYLSGCNIFADSAI